ncbi:hypothetical protein EHO57_13825 [Leptospira langatensis]|uniref:Uncharacterized protein n=1 Tax=Leptospira langatensis TaxID=2484983 RepID=A0A5R2ASR2_9LEPT|nr:hypothetical protein [Leptospira langatensis]TGJ99835.1 hypothetical protein EHO57_13825 [Leptospira langatensis]
MTPNQEPNKDISFNNHPRVCSLRAVLTECIAFGGLPHNTFQGVFKEIDDAFMERDHLLTFIERTGKAGDYEKFKQTGQFD